MFGQFLENLLQNVERGVVVFLGLLCCLIFALNAVLLGYLIVRRSGHGLARCPRCGRLIACPHCDEDDEEEDEPNA